MKNKKQRRVMFLLTLILGLTIGFALLSTTLKINGTAGIKGNTWNIHWNKNSINVLEGSVEAETPVVSKATSNDDTVSFDVELDLPGDFYEFEIDAINEGSIDGALDLAENFITYKIDNVEGNLPSYMDFKVTYDDNTTPTSGDVLKATESKTYKIRVEYKSNVEELPENPDPVEIVVEIPYIQHKENCPEPVSFRTDSWETIACNVRKGNTDKYSTNVTKMVDMGDYGSHPAVIVNKSTPEECSTTGFSQSACGFVISFYDSVALYKMNSLVDGHGNSIGGWRDSEMRTFVNSSIYNSLPADLKKYIIDTTVVSGHSSDANDTDNYTTTDKLYLLSIKEVYGRNSNGMDEFYSDSIGEDTASTFSRQLDMFSSMNVTVHGYSYYTSIARKYNNAEEWWWLRSPRKTYNDNFYGVMQNGVLATDNTSSEHGVIPAFRIG